MHVTSSMQKETAQSLPFRPFYWDVVGKDDNIAINIVSGQPSIQHPSFVVKIIAVISFTAAQQATVVIKYRTRCVCHLNYVLYGVTTAFDGIIFSLTKFVWKQPLYTKM